ncbi:MAG: arginine--tRNA ligase [Ignavibacteriae bacterium]|nr:arginine--tRNA ligase [Ignavibacteriota bacterium]
MMYDYIIKPFETALKTIGVEDVSILAFDIPKVAAHGDLSTNIAMLLAKKLGKPPRTIAQEIIEKLSFEAGIVSNFEIAGAGFINVRFGAGYYELALTQISKQHGDYGRTTTGKGLKVNVEYVSANPTGLLHIGHGRNTAIGDTVANLLEWTGHEVTREYYFNNAGNQMNNLALSIRARYHHKAGESDFPFPEDGYHGTYIQLIADEIWELHGSSLLDDSKETLELFRSAGEKWCFAAIMRTLDKMNVKQDVYYNEDSLYTTGKVKKVIEDLGVAGLSYDKDGAIWIALSKIDEKLTDRVIVKSSGEPTYRLPDIAYHRDKIERGFDLIIDILGADHIATIPDVMAGVKALGLDSSKIKVLIYQFVTLTENGEQVKMSKRTGKSYTLDDLIEELGADVVRFFFIMRGINTHLEFDLSLAREQSDRNPVFYLQYAHARISSIFANAAGKEISTLGNVNFSLLNHTAEWQLIRSLQRFPEAIKRASNQLEPQMIVEYLREVASSFHTFYHECPIVRAEENLRSARFKLLEITRIVLNNGLKILGISAPDKM